MVTALWFDAVFALKSLRRSPRFVAAALFSLGLGNALTVAAFGAINAVLLNPFPYREPGELCVVWGSTSWDVRSSIETAAFARWVSESRTIEDGELFQMNLLSFTLDGGETVRGTEIGPRIFSVLGVAPFLGRSFAGGRERESDRDAVVVSHAIWVSRFGTDPSIVGKTLRLNDGVYRVIGVMPPGFFFPEQHSDVWVLMDEKTPPHALVRLRPGATVEQAQAEVTRWSQTSETQVASSHRGRAGIFQLHAVITGHYRLALLTFLAAGIALLLIASANVSNLVLVRGHARAPDLAVSAALGATPYRMMRIVAAECLWLGVGGAAVGLAGGYGGLQGFRLLGLTEILRLDIATVDASLVFFSVCCSMISALIAALFSVIFAARADLRLLQSAGVGTRGTGGGQAQHLLITFETSLALVLLISAGLLAGSFFRLVRANWGFDPEQLVAIQVVRMHQRGGAQWEDLDRSVSARLSSVPGVEAVTMSYGIPILYSYRNESVGLQDRRAGSAKVWTVGMGYFAAMRIPLIRGREFGPQDGARTPRVTVVSKDLAERLWPGQDPIGRELTLMKFRQDILTKTLASKVPHLGQSTIDSPQSWEADGAPLRVIGEAGVVRAFGLDLVPTPTLYVDYRQDTHGSPQAFFVVRTIRNAALGVRPIRDAVSAAAGAEAVRRTVLVSELVQTSIGGRGTNKLLAVASVLVAGLGLLFATLGVFSVVSLVVAQRARESAVRMALGATPKQVLLGMLKRQMRPVLLGIGLGLASSVLATRPLESLLFGVKSMDPATVTAAIASLLLAACLGCVLPILRGLARDPADTLREQ